jgi:hypothetical protein
LISGSVVEVMELEPCSASPAVCTSGTGSRAQVLPVVGTAQRFRLAQYTLAGIPVFAAVFQLTAEQIAFVQSRAAERAAAGNASRDRAGEVHPDGRVRDRYGRLPRRRPVVHATLEPGLHADLVEAVAASGSTTSAWLAEAIALRLELGL